MYMVTLRSIMSPIYYRRCRDDGLFEFLSQILTRASRVCCLQAKQVFAVVALTAQDVELLVTKWQERALRVTRLGIKQGKF